MCLLHPCRQSTVYRISATSKTLTVVVVLNMCFFVQLRAICSKGPVCRDLHGPRCWDWCCWGNASAQREKGRRHRHDAGDEQVSSEFGWLNSLEAGREQAKKTGKPIMLVIRCIPERTTRIRRAGCPSRQIKDTAEQFVRVRLPRLESLDSNLFEFDFDLTMITFFLDADNHIYARYGGRDHQDAEGRQSLSGLEATMKSVLAMHASSSKSFVPTSKEPPVYVSDLTKGRRIGEVVVAAFTAIRYARS